MVLQQTEGGLYIEESLLYSPQSLHSVGMVHVPRAKPQPRQHPWRTDKPPGLQSDDNVLYYHIIFSQFLLLFCFFS